MIDIFSIPLYYIGFNPSDKIVRHYSDHGFKNINYFKAIDGRKMDPDKLRADNLITIRSYDDLKAGRREHAGMSSMGAIGCTMSHNELWKKCVEENWPYIIIAEDDNHIIRPLSEKNIQDISDALEKPNGIFISAKRHKFDNYDKHFYGLHFYFLTQGACKVLAEYCFPIDVQTDWYIKHLAQQGAVNVEGYNISEQRRGLGNSSIQTTCFTCMLPRSPWFYIGVILFGLFLLSLNFILGKKLKTCQDTLSSVSSSSES